MKPRTMVVIGAGGFAREVGWLIEDINRHEGKSVYEFLGYVVSDLSKISAHDDSEHILGDFQWLDSNRKGIDCVTLGVGTPGARTRLAEELDTLINDVSTPALVHPSVQMDEGTCEVGEGVLLCAGVIATVNVVFEPFSMVNLACTLGHEVVIGSGSVLNPTVNISGGVRLGNGVLVGTGAQVLQYVTVGDGATIGAGAVVTKDVAAGDTVVGVPAKPLSKS